MNTGYEFLQFCKVTKTFRHTEGKRDGKTLKICWWIVCTKHFTGTGFCCNEKWSQNNIGKGLMEFRRPLSRGIWTNNQQREKQPVPYRMSTCFCCLLFLVCCSSRCSDIQFLPVSVQSKYVSMLLLSQLCFPVLRKLHWKNN